MAKLAGSIKAWALNPVHLVGDFPGDDTKVDGGDGVINAGFIPGDVFAPTAEETNHEFSRWTSVLQWVQDGTSVGVATAGVVERAADGQINATRLVVVNAAGASGIDSTGDGGSDGVTGRSTRTGVHGLGSGAFPAVLGDCSSSGAGVQGTSTSGYGGRFTGGGAQAGVRGDGSATGSPGGIFNGTSGEPDLYLVPDGNYAIEIAAGATALGGITIEADACYALYASQAHVDWPVMSLTGAAGASSLVPTAEIGAAGAGVAMSLSNLGGTGYPLRLRPRIAGATVGALLISGQSARPSDTSAGQFTYLSTEAQFAHSSATEASWRGFLSTIGGMAQGKATAAGTAASGPIDAWQNSVLLTVSGADAPKVAGREILMRLTLAARSNTANAASRLALQLLDTTAGGPAIWSRATSNGYALPDPGPLPLQGWIVISIEIPVMVPLAGTRSWRLQYASALNSLLIKDVVLAFGPGML